jgi:hypothetical protein
MRQGSYVRQFLDELDAPAASLRPSCQVLQESFIAAVEPLADLIMGARGRTAGESAFAVRQLLVRSLNDIVAAFHLLVHGYVNQGYSTMRMAYEGTDIIELVATDTEQGALWVNSQNPWRDFGPRAVRKGLGKPEFDEFYDHLCAMSHPRFTAAHVTGYRVAPRDEEAAVPELVLRLGPFVIDTHPAVPLALGLLNSVLGLVVLRTSHLAITGAVTENVWNEALERSMAGQQRFVETLSSLLADAGIKGGDTVVDLYMNRPRL